MNNEKETSSKISQETPTNDFDYEYNTEAQGNVITKYTGSAHNVKIHEEIDGKSIANYSIKRQISFLRRVLSSVEQKIVNEELGYFSDSGTYSPEKVNYAEISHLRKRKVIYEEKLKYLESLLLKGDGE